MIEKVLGDRRRATDRLPVVTFEDNVELCAQAKVRMRNRFLAALLAAEHASFISWATECQKSGLCSLLPPQKKSLLPSSQLTIIFIERRQRQTQAQHPTQNQE
jgi:hypothetical protein